MKTALVILFSADGATGKVVSDLMPYDDAVAKAKEIVKSETADQTLPLVEVWSGAVRRFAIPSLAKATIEPTIAPAVVQDEPPAKPKK